MAITLKRQLNDEEKEIILKRHGRVCFANGHQIPDEDKVHFDHIRAFAHEGQSELDNIAPMCEHHNKAKGMLPLEDFRIKLRLEAFFNEGDRLTLRNLLEHLRKTEDVESFGESVAIEIQDEKVSLQHHSYTAQFQLQKCPRTG
jgi:hypothetical protein